MSAAGEASLTEDAFLGGRLRVRQPAEGFRAAIDPLLLAASLPDDSRGAILDLGCGSGIAALAALARLPGIEAVGLEIDPALARLSMDNAALNGLGRRFQALEGDVRSLPAGLKPGSFEQVICNPPFMEAGEGSRSSVPARQRAKHEGETALDDWAAAALALVRPKGRITLVHRADRLDDLLAAFHGRAGAVTIFPLWPGPAEAGKPARRILVRLRKGLRSPLRLLPGLVLHGPGGGYTEQAEAVLREGAGIDLESRA